MIGDDAAPRAERTVVLWNPPLLDAELGLRGSALAEAAKLQAGFVERGLRTLTFAKSRKAAELIHRFTAERLGDDSRLSPYRAGYTAAQRREIERRLAEGDLLGVSSTDALELGIDIGLLDAVISVGFPGHGRLAAPAVGPRGAARPRARRARRDRGRARPVLHARAGQAARPPRRGGDPRPREPSRPARPRAGGRVRGAARRRRRRDPRRTRRSRPQPRTRSCGRRPRGYVWAGTTTPAAADRRCARPIPTPSPSSTPRPGRCSGTSSGRAPTRPCTRAPSTSTPASRTSSRELDEATLRAVVEPFRGDWYTQPKRETETTVLGPRRTEHRLGLDLVFGEIEVTDRVVAYERKTIASQERIELVPLDCPPSTFETEAIWFCPEPEQLARPRRDAEAALDPPRRRARTDLDAAALGDVRPLGHRRPLDQPPPRHRSAPRSSSTTATPAASGSPSAASRSSRAGSPTRRRCSRRARATTAAPPASRARSAGT